ncbi:MAG: Flp pilus assembly complex ATPase component TadA [Erysipelotrichaceae bacterium]|nr:Flp pilus assembly complex ATPase component TadA [Erysipelotrichaceae bacterium]
MEERLLALLRLALKYNATDIHFMMRYQDVTIEMRIDGLCRKVKAKFEDYKLIRYLQYLANLDVGNILTPQTGQFEMEVDGNLLSLRFAVINKLNYTNGVLRILNSRLKVDANSLSSVEGQNRYFRSLLNRTCGLVLFSGPTGSGKTTTLYSLLKSIRNRKIYTIEDPIEVYHDEFIQLAVNEATGFDYSEGIKQILRHDPDIIMIGEIRDDKAAKMAVVAANTGHLVLSTIHTSRASSCISRMVELGVNEEHLYENLICVANQRMMINKNNKNKVVLYEIMDQNEIEYFRNNKRNSPSFWTIEMQIRKGINEGIFEGEVY